jgi:hypothetical protein
MIKPDGRYSVTLDGHGLIDAQPAPVRGGCAFGISVSHDPETGAALILDDIELHAADADWTAVERERTKAEAIAQEIIAGERNELKDLVFAAFNAHFEANPIYRLSMFRQPVNDARALRNRLPAASPAQRRAILYILGSLPTRLAAHIEAMERIGQPAHLEPKFQQALTETVDFLQTMLDASDSPPDTDQIKETIRKLTRGSHESG